MNTAHRQFNHTILAKVEPFLSEMGRDTFGDSIGKLVALATFAVVGSSNLAQG